MATKKTAVFTLSERLNLVADATETFATIDLGSYVDVGDRQALQIHSVEYIFQGQTPIASFENAMAGDSFMAIQVTDLNRGGLVFANDRALVSSAAIYKSTASTFEINMDQYPDNFGKGSDDGRYVVNDQLYITGFAENLGGTNEINATIRVNCSIVTLSAKDFMAIAIQSTAADN